MVGVMTCLSTCGQYCLTGKAHADTLAHRRPVCRPGRRELAKLDRRPAGQVITIGTLFNGTPEQAHAGGIYRLLNGEKAQISPAMRRRLASAPPVPTTSIYNVSDGVVAWQTCRHDRPTRPVQDVEMQGGRLAMGENPRVLRVLRVLRVVAD